MCEMKTQVLPRNCLCAQNIVLMFVLLSAIQDLLFKRMAGLPGDCWDTKHDAGNKGAIRSSKCYVCMRNVNLIIKQLLVYQGLSFSGK